jgi:CheY-like chemotaxis protein
VIIDDHVNFRERLETFVSEQSGCSVAGLAGDSSTGFRLVHSIRPDIVLIDVDLADESGLQLAARLAGLDLGLRIVLMGENEATEYERAAALAGANAYVSKTEISQLLPRLLRSGTSLTGWRSQAPFDGQGSLVTQASAIGSTWGSAALHTPSLPRYATWEALFSAAALLGGIAINQPTGALAGALGFAFLSYRQMTLPRFHGGQPGERVLRRTRSIR